MTLGSLFARHPTITPCSQTIQEVRSLWLLETFRVRKKSGVFKRSRPFRTRACTRRFEPLPSTFSYVLFDIPHHCKTQSFYNIVKICREFEGNPTRTYVTNQSGTFFISIFFVFLKQGILEWGSHAFLTDTACTQMQRARQESVNAKEDIQTSIGILHVCRQVRSLLAQLPGIKWFYIYRGSILAVCAGM
jgi:hypothetical protein